MVDNQDPDPQEIILVPVDEDGRVLLFTDLKIEQIDPEYRTIRDPNGLTWKIIPGDYTVKIFLRNLQMKSVPLHVEPGVSNYRLNVPTDPEFARPAASPASPPQPESSFSFETPKKQVLSREVIPPAPIQARQSGSERRGTVENTPAKRYPISFPVSYRTDAGKWIQAKALNISGTGICVENIGRISEDANLYVRLHVPVATIPIECPARVVWVTSKDNSQPCMGLQLFLTANMRESLDRWLSGM
jgi:PilZ domain-containing protein